MYDFRACKKWTGADFPSSNNCAGMEWKAFKQLKALGMNESFIFLFSMNTIIL